MLEGRRDGRRTSRGEGPYMDAGFVWECKRRSIAVISLLKKKRSDDGLCVLFVGETGGTAFDCTTKGNEHKDNGLWTSRGLAGMDDHVIRPHFQQPWQQRVLGEAIRRCGGNGHPGMGKDELDEEGG